MKKAKISALFIWLTVTTLFFAIGCSFFQNERNRNYLLNQVDELQARIERLQIRAEQLPADSYAVQYEINELEEHNLLLRKEIESRQNITEYFIKAMQLHVQQFTVKALRLEIIVDMITSPPITW